MLFYGDDTAGSRNPSWARAERELELGNGAPCNIGWICSDRICNQGYGHHLALIREGPDGPGQSYTYDALRCASNAMGHFLRSLGLDEQDRICLFMDRIPELYFGFLGILKIGAIAQPLFSAFGPESLAVRLADAQTSAILTQRRHLGKVRQILGKLPHLQRVIVVDHEAGRPLRDIEVSFSLREYHQVEYLEPARTHRDSPSVLHYTSGTTGQPKGVLHAHGSVVSQYLTSKEVLGLRPEDVYWCTADPGWVTGTSYGMIGPWSLGATVCVLDSGFSAPAWYGFLERNRVTVWYSAPTAIRSLMRAGKELVKTFDLSSLRHLSSVGEPLNAEAVLWSERTLGLPFHDTYWQTETGSIMIANQPGMKIKPGSMGRPFPGITARLLDPVTHEEIREPHRPGLLAFKPDWPALMRTYWQNPEAFDAKFSNGWYTPGDQAHRDEEGYYWFVGRDDDVINTAGHLVSPFEVESALLEHEAVAESAVVGKPDALNMEVVKAFISLKPGFSPSAELELSLMNFIRKTLSALAMPQEITFVETLPRTRSGKIMRRMLRAREWGQEIGDTSTLERDSD